jgi:hypothetical protein
MKHEGLALGQIEKEDVSVYFYHSSKCRNIMGNWSLVARMTSHLLSGAHRNPFVT